MDETGEILDSMIRHLRDGSISLVLRAEGTVVQLSDPGMLKLPAGGSAAYALEGSSADLGIVPRLSDMMLGPSTEFARLKIETDFPPGSGRKAVLHGRLASFRQGAAEVRLRIEIDKASLL